VTAQLPPIPVTVVIPAFDRAALVGRAVASALSQQLPPAEVLVVDDASTDGTADAAELAGARVIRLTENRGRAGARNVGIEAASQEFIAFLDSDDEWYPGHLSALWPHRDEAVLLAASTIGSLSRRVEGNPTLVPRILGSPRDVLWPVNPIPTSTVLVRKLHLQAVGGFAALDLCEDLDLWIRLLERGKGLVMSNLSATYHEHEGQASQDRSRMRLAEMQVLDSYRSRPWYDDSIRRRLQVKNDWDGAHAAVATGDRAAAGRHLVNLLTVQRLFWLAWLWRCRHRMAHPRLEIEEPVRSSPVNDSVKPPGLA
jgi:glycosyltransferase involved in cell wall biosynthesis